MRKILFVNHSNKKCGVYQYGFQVFQVLNSMEGYEVDYFECETAEQLTHRIKSEEYWAVLYNYHDYTLPFVNPLLLKRLPKLIHVCLAHELTQEIADAVDGSFFDYYIYGDPSLEIKNPRVFKIGRIVPEFVNKQKQPEVLTVGSFGFAGALKQFEYLIDLVQDEFDQARIRINIAYNDVMDVDGVSAKKCAELCLSKVKKPGIKLEITHHFFTQMDLLNFLGGNTINVFPYLENGRPGVSSAVDQALAVQRPLAVSDCYFFRHLFSIKPSIVLPNRLENLLLRAKVLLREVSERKNRVFFQKDLPSLRFLYDMFIKSKKQIPRNSLKAIIANGIEPLEHLRKQWTPQNFRNEAVEIFNKIAYVQEKQSLNCLDFNHVLDDSARILYQPAIKEMTRLAPDIIAQKIYRANVQQAFVFEAVKHFYRRGAKILCVGGYHDTACYALEKLGYQITNIDPEINIDLNTFFHARDTKKGSFDIIFSTSVIEHVENDQLFFEQVQELLTPGGVGIFTCDFKNDYKLGDDIFSGNFRFYTSQDLKDRVMGILKECDLIDPPKWNEAVHDFVYGGKTYAFATLVFRKNQTVPVTLSEDVRCCSVT